MSVAGKRKGTDDDRYLLSEMFRLIREIKPQFVGENVQGIINIQNGMVLRQVQDDLESEGFEVNVSLFQPSGIGAWHQRKRVWIIGCKFPTPTSVQNQTKATGLMRNKSLRTNNKRGGITMVGKCVQSTRQSEDVSNTNNTRREPRNIKQRQRLQRKGQSQLNSSSKMYPIPTVDAKRGTTIGESRENKVWGFYSEKEKQTRVDIRSKIVGCNVAPEKKPGGKLNPTFVEFLMGFPMNWTKTEPTESKPSETQSSHRSQEN